MLSTLENNQPRKSTPQLYSDDVLQRDLFRVQQAWKKSRRRHDRFSVYQYLTPVYDLVAVWQKEGGAISRAKRALKQCGFVYDDRVEPFSAVIRCTSRKVDPKAVSKWARALMFAAKHKSPREPLERFIRGYGINGCATELTRLRRNRPGRSEIRD